MRIIIDFPADLLKNLDRLSQYQQISRAEAIRRAVAIYLKQQALSETAEAFGLWRDREIDALAYEDRLRDEWERHKPSEKRSIGVSRPQ